jgi:AcrR family transcriptional regulator
MKRKPVLITKPEVTHGDRQTQQRGRLTAKEGNKPMDIINTFPRITSDIENACRSTDGSPEERLQAGMMVLASEMRLDPLGLHLLLVAPLHGREGQLYVHSILTRSETLLSDALRSAFAEHAVPAQLIRGIVGGIHRVIFSRLLHDQDQPDAAVLSDEMVQWALLLASPATNALALRSSTRPPLPETVQLPASDPDADDRTRIQASVINLALRLPKDQINDVLIAKESGLSTRTFRDHFEDPAEALTATLDMLGGELLEVVADPALLSAQWPIAVCQAIDRLTAYLVETPAVAVMLATRAIDADIEGVEQMLTLADEVTTLLIDWPVLDGLKARREDMPEPQWVAGALAHMLQGEIMDGRAHQLDMISEYLSYIVLAPYLGATRATQMVLSAREIREQ